tara:strand:+ start:681 stop:1079 length:399 start_codon:yes stop_codon:yes gene_type:complete
MFKRFKNINFKPITDFYNWLFVEEKERTERTKAVGTRATLKKKHDSNTPKETDPDFVYWDDNSEKKSNNPKALKEIPKKEEVIVRRARSKDGRYRGDDKSTLDINEAWVGGERPRPRGRVLPKNKPSDKKKK